MKAMKRLSLGHLGETIAATYLEKKGYSIKEKNSRTPYGEIDLVTMVDSTVIFVEVKTRASTSLGPPEISITTRKIEHMRSAAHYYIQQHPELSGEYRLDVIAILVNHDQPPIIDHFENVA